MQFTSSSQQMRLSDLTALISEAINQPFRNQSFWVIAEVNDHSYKADKNYHYFSLVEKHAETHQLIAKVSVVSWASGSIAIAEFQRITGQKFTNHIQVLVNVSVQYHPVYGLQLTLHQIDPNFTLGALARQREETLKRLVEENADVIQKSGEVYITHNKRLTLNRVIQHIAVICSKTSAGWQDFKHTLDNNPHGYVFRTDAYYTVVQGEANTQQLVDALIAVFQSAKLYDAVVIIRGGGSQTDFLIFDQYIVGKAIAKFPIPVITGIGHQRNETIADLMAHSATKTPTKAAELIVDRNRSFEESVRTLQQQIIIRTQQRFTSSVQDVGQIQSSIVNRTQAQMSAIKDNLVRIQQTSTNRVRLLLTHAKDVLISAHQTVVNKTQTILLDRHRHLINLSSTLSTRPRVAVADKNKDLQRITSSMKTLVPILLQSQKGNLGHHVSMINALSPESTLKRGFAIVKVEGAVTSDPDKIIIGKDIDIVLANKSITAGVKIIKDYNGTDFNV